MDSVPSKLVKDLKRERPTESDILKPGTFLGRMDIVIILFASLIINLFSLAVPMVTLQVYDRILAFHSDGTLQVLCGGIFIIVLLEIAMKLCRSALIGWTSARFENAACMGALRHIMNTRMEAVKGFSPGEHLHRLGAVARLKNFYSGQELINLIDLPFVIVFLGFIAYLAGGLVLVPLVLLGLFGVYASRLGGGMKEAMELRDIDEDRRVNFVSEVLERIHTVKMLGLESTLQRRHEAMQGRHIRDSHLLGALNAQMFNAAALFTQIMMISMISIGATRVLDGHITMGVLIACVLLSGRVMQPVQRALSFWVSFQGYRLAREKMNELFAMPLKHTLAANSLKPAKGRLEIRNAAFSYSGDLSKPLFKDINLTLAPGRTIALEAPSGNGKSTLLKLIAGLYAPTAGQILIDGMDAASIPASEIAKYVGYLPSEAEIFQGTVMENLTGFRPELEEQALEMADWLGIDKVVSKLSQGYQTKLFDSPADLMTPGMKQRVTIGRVLVNRPRLILFDSADKSLDKNGYNHVFRLLGQLKGKASMILVSNDRNILHLATDDYVMENRRLLPKNDSTYSKSDSGVVPFRELRT